MRTLCPSDNVVELIRVSERIPQALPPEIQFKLRAYPFTRPSFKDVPKRGPLDAITRRQSIRSELHAEASLNDGDFEFLKEHLEEARRLKDHIENQFWLKFEALANSRRDPE